MKRFKKKANAHGHADAHKPTVSTHLNKYSVCMLRKPFSAVQSDISNIATETRPPVALSGYIHEEDVSQ